MNVLFISGCLEPGRDGVGDYTRILATELVAKGIDARILAIRDSYVPDFEIEAQFHTDHSVTVYRVPASEGIRKGFNWAKQSLLKFVPDWISLQYVPYAYNSQGIPGSLPGLLGSFMPDSSIHLMVHEAYNHGKLSVKNKLVSYGQIHVLKSLSRLHNLKLIHTTNFAYKTLLNEIGIRADLLGLYGNIPISKKVLNTKSEKSSVLRAVYFGASPVSKDFETIANGIKYFLNSSTHILEIIFCGKAGSERNEFIQVLTKNCSNQLLVRDFGTLGLQELSELFLSVDFGIARVAPPFIGKSGTAISILEHGLPLYIPLAINQEEIDSYIDFRPEQCFWKVSDIAGNLQRYQPESRIDEIREKLLGAFTQSNSFVINQKSLKVLVSHPTGNANVRATIGAFSKYGILTEFNTTIATNPGSGWLRIIPASFRTEFLRRSYQIEKNLIRQIPSKEIGRIGSQKLGIKKLIQHEHGKFSVDAVYHSVDHSVARRISKLNDSSKPDAVYAYEDGALATFIAAEKLNITRIYDLPKGYWRAERDLLQREQEVRPDWGVTFAGFNDSEKKLNRKDEELRRAEHIIVASSFTKRTLEYYSGDLAPTSVVPYGFPEVIEGRDYTFGGNRKLKLLFVGSLSQLKGLANVIEAVAELQEYVELTIIGRKKTTACEPLNAGLQKHRYIESLPHEGILREMRNHDVFVFPSLFEGFGLVVTEAMSQGTPVITTNRTCGADMIIPNVDGWIVEPGSTQAIVSQINLILDSPELVEHVGREAMEKARSRPWSKYGKELVEVVDVACKAKKLN